MPFFPFFFLYLFFQVCEKKFLVAKINRLVKVGHDEDVAYDKGHDHESEKSLMKAKEMYRKRCRKQEMRRQRAIQI